MTDHTPDPILPDDSRSPEGSSPGPIPEVFPDKHILPEMPEEQQAILKGKPLPKPGKRATEAPQFIEPPARAGRKDRAPSAPGQSQQATGSTPVAEPVKSTRKGDQRATPRGKQSGKARTRPPRYPLVAFFSTFRSLLVTFTAAVSVATIFMWWTSPSFLAPQVASKLAPVRATARQILATRTPIPTPYWFNRIGILAGHTGINPRTGVEDPGAVCNDGFFERQVTENVAAQVIAMLRGRGYTVDLLKEYPFEDLNGYQAAAFLALHADSCENFGYGGFKSSYPVERFNIRDQDLRLDECIKRNYEAVTGLEFRPGSITVNMTNYHAFRRIAPTTPAVILEVGFLSYDRNLLQNRTDLLALGVVNGLMCFIAPTALATQQAVPTPTDAGQQTLTPQPTIDPALVTPGTPGIPTPVG